MSNFTIFANILSFKKVNKKEFKPTFMRYNPFPDRFSLLRSFFIFYILFSFLIRIGLYFWSFSEIDFSLVNTICVFGLGLLYDLGSISYILLPYVVYLTFFPTKWHGSKLDKILTYIFFSLFTFILNFSFLAEITFWDEYQRRFNFISVDYLLYTYEVVENIEQSYPLPLIITAILGLTILVFRITSKNRRFKKTFLSQDVLKTKISTLFLFLGIVSLYQFGIKNEHAEQFENQFENEISKSGVFSFFAAYNSNELNYTDFYKTLNPSQINKGIKDLVKQNEATFNKNFKNPIARTIVKTKVDTFLKPNIMFICVESLNSNFMAHFGNTEELTPYMDSLITESVSMTNLQATGTRTIRGLEAITMCIPPTPGRSILKRENNKNLFTVGDIFREKGYSRTFYYGGDSHFDNMVTYFGNNGYDIVDRKKEHRFDDLITTKRTRIADEEVTFENAWGACDEDLFEKVLKMTDQQFASKQPFFNFVMTSSNHPPFTFPEGKITVTKNNSKREGAVKYTDYAVKEFMEKAKQKPWFKNTVFVFVADHNAYSAGRTEINVRKYHIPGFIYNLPNQKPQELNQLCSQIDVFPTLFGYLGWEYKTKVFGIDIRTMQPHEERAFISNHRKLSLRKGNDLVILDSHKDARFFKWKKADNSLMKIPENEALEREAILYYQSAYSLYKKGLMQSIVE